MVLVDIWEYTCINWIRTSPYVKAWHRDYAELGLVVIGLHAPEFEFGKRAENIDRGIRDHGLTYPIALDNDFTPGGPWATTRGRRSTSSTREGRLVKRWIGEGRYDEMEAEIRRLLVAARPGTRIAAGQPPRRRRTRDRSAFIRRRSRNETYVGTERREPGTFRAGR